MKNTQQTYQMIESEHWVLAKMGKLAQNDLFQHSKNLEGVVVPPFQIQNLFEGIRGPQKIINENVGWKWTQVATFRWELR